MGDLGFLCGRDAVPLFPDVPGPLSGLGGQGSPGGVAALGCPGSRGAGSFPARGRPLSCKGQLFTSGSRACDTDNCSVVDYEASGFGFYFGILFSSRVQFETFGLPPATEEGPDVPITPL